MYQDQRIIAIIPARSGSKGLPDKNIRSLRGKPLMAYSIDAARATGIFDEIFISTDSQEYADIAARYGGNASILRSAEMSTDTASTWDCVQEVLEHFHSIGKDFDIFIVLQPTSPLRKAKDIVNVIEIMTLNHADSVVSVCEADHSPLWYNTLSEGNSLNGFLRPEILTTPRQELPTYYRINGAIYAVKIDYFRQSRNIYAGKSLAYIMPRENSIDIDSLLDFSITEYLLSLKL